MGQLSNINYLLIYDDEIAEKATSSKLLSQNLNLFLEKIVQYKVELPPPDDQDIETFFILLLREFLDSTGEKLTEETQRRLADAWYNVLQYYLTTPRKIKMLANSFSIAFSIAQDGVDIVDLLLLETLRLFDRSVYSWIRDNIGALVD